MKNISLSGYSLVHVTLLKISEPVYIFGSRNDERVFNTRDPSHATSPILVVFSRAMANTPDTSLRS